MFDKLIKYLLGYLNVQIEGYYLEQFLNLCKKEKIKIWNIYRRGDTYLHFNILIKDFKHIKKIIRKTKIKVHIKKKIGLIFLCKQYKKRKLFLVLCLICVGIIVILSNYIWNVEIDIINGNIDENELISYMEKEGIYVGALKKKVKLKNIVNKVRLERKDIAWIAIDIKGTNAIIKVSKATKKPEIVNEKDICNIVSDKIAVITKINVRNGTALVKEGDIVKKDDILVGGWIEGKYTEPRYVHSDADIEAKVWYTKKTDIKLIDVKKRYTGDKTTEMGIYLGKKQIIFYKRLHKFENYDKIEENKKLKLFSNFYIPLGITKTTYMETEKNEENINFDEAKNMAIEQLKNELNDEINQNSNVLNIENEKVNTYEVDGKQEVEVVYEVIENIGRKQKFE